MTKIAQLFHKLSHYSYMFRHCRVILREPVVSTLPSYTSISNAAVGNYLLTYSTEQSPSWEANRFAAASQEIPRIYGTRKFLTVPTSDRHRPYPEPTPSSPHDPLQLRSSW